MERLVPLLSCKSMRNSCFFVLIFARLLKNVYHNPYSSVSSASLRQLSRQALAQKKELQRFENRIQFTEEDYDRQSAKLQETDPKISSGFTYWTTKASLRNCGKEILKQVELSIALYAFFIRGYNYFSTRRALRNGTLDTYRETAPYLKEQQRIFLTVLSIVVLPLSLKKKKKRKNKLPSSSTTTKLERRP